MLRTCRKYLYWVQNSVFEGEITEGRLKKLIIELERIMDKEEDSVIIYKLWQEKYAARHIIGVKKGGAEKFL